MGSVALDELEDSTVPPERGLRVMLIASEFDSDDYCSPNWLTFELSDIEAVLRCKVGGQFDRVV